MSSRLTVEEGGILLTGQRHYQKYDGNRRLYGQPRAERTGGTVILLAEAREAHLMLEGTRLRPQGKIVLAVERGKIGQEAAIWGEISSETTVRMALSQLVSNSAGACVLRSQGRVDPLTG